jgi:hypothetical protein
MASQEPGTTPDRPTPEEPMPAEPGTMPEQEARDCARAADNA